MGGEGEEGRERERGGGESGKNELEKEETILHE